MSFFNFVMALSPIVVVLVGILGFRQSAKRDPRTGEYDKIYCFWYAEHEGKGHWKTVGRHSKGVPRPRSERSGQSSLPSLMPPASIPLSATKLPSGR